MTPVMQMRGHLGPITCSEQANGSYTDLVYAGLVATVSAASPNLDNGAPGPSPLGAGEARFSRSTRRQVEYSRSA